MRCLCFTLTTVLLTMSAFGMGFLWLLHAAQSDRNFNRIHSHLDSQMGIHLKSIAYNVRMEETMARMEARMATHTLRLQELTMQLEKSTVETACAPLVMEDGHRHTKSTGSWW